MSRDVFRYRVVINYETIPANTMLYRAALTVEQRPTPRLCLETGKTGVYFSMNHPYLAETMIIERGIDMPIAVYITTAPLRVVVGKYTIPGEVLRELQDITRDPRNMCENRSELENEAHIDHEIEPIISTYFHPSCPDPDEIHPQGSQPAELFLTARELRHVQYIGCYFRSVNEVQNIWNTPEFIPPELQEDWRRLQAAILEEGEGEQIQ